MTLQVWTARVSYGGPGRLDVTRKSGDEWAKTFAPSWGLLRPALRARESSAECMAAAWAWYVPRFIDEMRRSYTERRADWDRLLAMPRAVLVCYCVDHEQCHRTLLARDILPKLGATYMGESGAGGGDVTSRPDAFELRPHVRCGAEARERPREERSHNRPDGACCNYS